jgi:glyoxylase-like metal-dependent hydrolase (beta-lactamase superfamily II)
MRIKSLAPLALITAIGCASVQSPEQRIVHDAAAALGGVDKVRKVRTMTMEGGGEVFALGQNRTLDGPLLKWQVTGYRRAFDFEQVRWRDDATQTPAFVTGWPDPANVGAGYQLHAAYDLEGGEASSVDDFTTNERYAAIFHHPIGFLRAALSNGARLERARTEGDQQAVDLIASFSSQRITLYVDRDSHLPRRIVSTSHVDPLGDVTLASTFDEFIDAQSSAFAGSSGVKVPARITSLVDETVVSDLKITQAVVNPSPHVLGDLRARAAPARGTPLVIDEEVAPGIWYLTGEGHHSVVVEFSDHLTLIEAPGRTRTHFVIKKARELRPGKPVTQVINTHHHFDHSGGIREAIAEGLTVIAHEANRAFYERIAARPATLAQDAQQRKPRPLAIETVSGTKVLSDRTRRLEIYAIKDSPHAAAFLMVYFPKERLLVEADAYQPPPRAGVPPRMHPFAANLLDNIRDRGLRVDRIVPIHGYIVPFADLVAAARTSPPALVQ